MSHHSDDALNAEHAKLAQAVFEDRLRDKMHEAMREVPPIAGATGKHPNGRITAKDEGEVRMVVASHDGVIVLDFGKPVAWIGFTSKEARGLAELLLKHADQVDGR